MDMAPTSVPSPPPQPSPTTSTSTSTSQTRQTHLSNPLPLSATQEAQVRALYYAAVRTRCAPEIAAFASCARNRTVTVTWMCRAQRLAMNSCMVAHATVEEEDRAREEWFRSREAKKREREQEERTVEERRKEVIDLIRKQEEKEMVRRADGKEAKERGGGFWGSARR